MEITFPAACLICPFPSIHLKSRCQNNLGHVQNPSIVVPFFSCLIRICPQNILHVPSYCVDMCVCFYGYGVFVMLFYFIFARVWPFACACGYDRWALMPVCERESVQRQRQTECLFVSIAELLYP